MPMLEQQDEACEADCGKEKEHIPYPLMGGGAGNLAQAVEADQHDPQPRDQQGELGPDARAVPEYEPGDQCAHKKKTTKDQKTHKHNQNKNKTQVDEQG